MNVLLFKTSFLDSMGNQNQKLKQNSQNPNQSNEDEEAATLTCEICIKPITHSNPKFKNSNRCAHSFCTDCIITYIQVKLQDNVSDIKCPEITCNHSLEPLSCRPKLARQVFDKWCDALFESAVLKFERLYCPNKYCSEVMVKECGESDLKRCVCPYCQKPFCFRCKVPWHDGYRCKESEETRDENDVAFDVLSKRKRWKRCPTCGHCVERASGCNIVRCRCGTRFCYRCGKEANNHHSCKYKVFGFTHSFCFYIFINLLVFIYWIYIHLYNITIE